jgi:hypothetical protein
MKEIFSFSPAERSTENDIKHTRIREGKKEKTFCAEINNHSRMRDLDEKSSLSPTCVCVCSNFHPLFRAPPHPPVWHNRKRSSLSFCPLCFLQFPPIII